MTVFVHPPARAGDAFISAWWRSLEHDIPITELTPFRAVKSPMSVVHVHWPEHLFHDAERPRLKLAYGIITSAILILRPGPLVLTMHNREPHAGFRGKADRWLYRRLIARADRVVRLLDETVAEDGAWANSPSVVIPLAPIDAPRPCPWPDRSDPVRLLHLGSVASYKSQVEVVNALEPLLREGAVELTIVGRVLDDGVAAELARRQSQVPSVTLVFDHVDTDALAMLLDEHHIVVGVQRNPYNSGVPATALPAGRPVVLTSGAQASDHRRRYGSDWVLEVSDPASAAEWRRLIEAFEQPKSSIPALPTTIEVASAHAALYRSLMR